MDASLSDSVQASRVQDEVADLAQRREALDPTRSFIVQAPAGSGKTELLIQRYLVLLARVEKPEEIAAITFTRKAAAEMRKRVLEALAAAGEPRPEEPHRALTWEHARAALARDTERDWRLQANAARLRIQTIDALCASLTRQMPVLAHFGAQPGSIEDAQPCYREAAHATLALLEGGDAHSDDLAILLEHLDNNLDAAEQLIADMLARRDHWVRNLLQRVGSEDDRAALEAALAGVRRDAMLRAGAAAARALAGDAAELCTLATYAANNLTTDGRASPIREAADLAAIPGAAESDMHAWQGLAELLLTQAGEWRKQVTVAQGFPAGTDKATKAVAKEWKERHASLLARIASGGSTGGAGRQADEFRVALHGLRGLPPARYSEAQWQLLGAIARVLPLSVAQLKLVFAARGEADFVEIAQGALQALGTSDAPTDLLLALDHRIHHILVDEFQDTSFTQFELLQKLTAGWSGAEEGRTLFLVGDPMQSIYRFREAEVGLFLKARNEGIGDVQLVPLTLSANFRSQADIVDWVNQAFAQVMPVVENIAAGAVPYSRSDAVRPAADGAVCVHAYFNGDSAGEAEQVALLAEAAQQEEPAGTVAVLVRNRRHLQEIVPRLKARGLRFRAIEIEALGHRQTVQDLLSLTRALAHPADRLAWLACLRAPWCGLTLADLQALVALPTAPANQPLLFPELVIPSDAQDNVRIDIETRTPWELLQDEARLARLSADGHARALRFRTVLAGLIATRLRGSLRARVESAWLALGGPACALSDIDLEDAEVYLDFLEDQEQAGEVADFDALEEGVARLYAQPDLAADPKTAVQIMTIHKAKGLEFDTVILPGLGRKPRMRDARLFIWLERTSAGGRSGEAASQLLIAPIKPTGSERDPIYDYLVQLDAEKEAHENGRLLYVAATRAKQHLHLLGDTKLTGSGDEQSLEVKAPVSSSLLARLWPAVEAQFVETARTAPLAVPSDFEDDEPAAEGDAGGESVAETGGEDAQLAVTLTIDPALRRLPADWALPEVPASVACSLPPAPPSAAGEIEFSWVGETARHVGSVVHRWLQRIAADQMKGWTRGRIEKMRAAFRDELAARGVAPGEVDVAVARVAFTLAHALEDPRGRWLLGPQSVARNEYRVSARINGVRRNLVIDRTFVDSEGARWIVDYKTSGHEGGDLDAFLDRERQRYTAQLERYAQALTGGVVGLDVAGAGSPELGPAGRPRLGLYFPLVAGWRDWTSGEPVGDDSTNATAAPDVPE